MITKGGCVITPFSLCFVSLSDEESLIIVFKGAGLDLLCTHIHHAHTCVCTLHARAHTHTHTHTHTITPVLVSEDTLLEGDKTVPLGSVNTSDELVPTLPSCSDDDSFDGAPTPVADCSKAVDVNAF